MRHHPTTDNIESARRLLARDDDGVRQCIPVVGTGLNIQAATLAGYPHRDDWWELFTRIGDRVLPNGTSIDTLPRAPLSLWKTLVCRWARAEKVYPFEAEDALQVLIGSESRRQEELGVAPALFLAIGDAPPPHLRARREVKVLIFDSPDRLRSSFLEWIA